MSCLEDEEESSIANAVWSSLYIFTRNCSHVEIITDGLLQFVIDGIFLETPIEKLSKIFGQTYDDEEEESKDVPDRSVRADVEKETQERNLTSTL